jgi:four helix bundle protein
MILGDRIYDRKQFARDLEKRTLDFAVRIIHLSIKLPNTTEGKVIKRQITRSGTSIGANYREANRSRPKADFKNRISICESEASETQYWMEIILATKWLGPEELKSHCDECAQLLALFTSIRKRLQ